MSQSAKPGVAPAPTAVHRTTRWSTHIELVVTDPGEIVAAASLLERELDRVEQVASRFRADSELNALHRAADAGRPVPVSADLCEAIGIALRAAELSGGAVDPTVGAALCRLGYDRDFALIAAGVDGRMPAPAPVPGWRSVLIDPARSTVLLEDGVVLDLGATAKAWAADRAATQITARLGCGTMVSLGGDLSVQAAPAGGFTVGIADVCGDADAPTTVSVESGGLATSGVGRRHWTLGGTRVHHLVDPATGLPVGASWRTVSVAAGSCVDANIASTAAMVLGDAAPGWLDARHLPARLVREDGSVVAVAGWPEDSREGGSRCR